MREKEALDILWACEMFRYYVANDHFTKETDHESLKWLMELEKPPRLVRWAIGLSKYNFTIVPKAGKLNNTADALSRLPLEGKYFSYASEDVDEKLTYSSSNINSFGFTEIDSND